jgi:hypothetical protein
MCYELQDIRYKIRSMSYEACPVQADECTVYHWNRGMIPQRKIRTVYCTIGAFADISTVG